jgi:peptidoglycan/LPS O-acetylase OafA/YrhL
MTRRSGFMQAGDALRALAALMVVAYHVLLGSALAAGGPGARNISTSVLMRDAYGGPLGTVAAHLNAGLYVFFALTGYFVGGPYVRAWITGGPAPAAGRYLARRARRIVPAFWLFAAISILVLHPRDNSALDVASVFGFAQNYHASWARTAIIQAWTLDIEAAFYLALPVVAVGLAALLRGRAIRPVAVLAALAVVAAASLAITPRYPALTDAFSMSLPAMLWAFVPGLALAAAEPLLAPRLRGRAGRVAAIGLLGVSAAGFALVAHIATARTVPHLLALTLFAGGLVAAALTWQWAAGGAPRWVANRATNALGRWSYGIYLCHWVLSLKLIELATTHGSAKQTALVAGPLTLAATIATAALSWRLLERPILTWRSPPRTAPAPATA